MLVDSFFTEDEIENLHNYPEENITLYKNRALDAYRSTNDSEFESIVLLGVVAQICSASCRLAA